MSPRHKERSGHAKASIEWTPAEKVGVLAQINQEYLRALRERIDNRLSYQNVWKKYFKNKVIVNELILEEARRIDRAIFEKFRSGKVSSVADAVHQINQEKAFKEPTLHDILLEESVRVPALRFMNDIAHGQWFTATTALAEHERFINDNGLRVIHDMIVPIIRQELSQLFSSSNNKEQSAHAITFVQALSSLSVLRSLKENEFPDIASRVQKDPFIKSEIRKKMKVDFKKESKIELYVRLGCEKIGIPLAQYRKWQKEDARSILVEALENKNFTELTNKRKRILEGKILSEEEILTIPKIEGIVRTSLLSEAVRGIDGLADALRQVLSANLVTKEKFYSYALEAFKAYLTTRDTNRVISWSEYKKILALAEKFDIGNRKDMDVFLDSLGLTWSHN